MCIHVLTQGNGFLPRKSRQYILVASRKMSGFQFEEIMLGIRCVRTIQTISYCPIPNANFLVPLG